MASPEPPERPERPDSPQVALPHEHPEVLGRGTPVPGSLYGLMAEFEGTEQLVEAIEKARAQGYREMDAYTPFPAHDVAEALGVRGTRLPLIVLLGGLIGLASGYFLQYYTAVIAYPLNVGGRPFNSWPSFMPVTFEMTILLATLAAVLGMLALNGLPMPYHPVFNVERFSAATRDRFFLVIEAEDPHFEYDETRRFMESLHPSEVMDVPH